MAIKKYSSGAWVPTTYRRYGTETDTITSLPAQIIGDGQAITSCQISGNTLQDGTPTPEAPMDVVGCGVRTGNLVDPTVRIIDANISSLGRIEDYIPGNYDLGYFQIIQGNTYTIDSYVYAFYDTIPTRSSVAYDNQRVIGEYGRPSSFTAPITGYCCFRVDYGDSFMANAGSTAMPYEPYGYKLPLTVNGVEYPIYLGEVPTTRKIKKLVLDGTENWGGNNTSPTKQLTLDGYYLTNAIICVCTHYDAAENVHSGDTIPYNSCCFYLSPPYNVLFLKGDESSGYPKSIAEFKAWLASQYAAGTPVTIWYVLANEETGIVNEPIRKIGDYADTVAATNIPTTGTPENFDIGTTLKPSEVQLTYHGWHEHTDTKYTQGE